MIKYLCLYLVVINAITLLAYGIDKMKAKKGAYRIPEKTLIDLAIIGGSIGAILGMVLFRHKIRKPPFAVGLPVILALQIAAAVVIKIRFF